VGFTHHLYDRWGRFASCNERHMDRFSFVSFNSPSFLPGFSCEEGGLEFLGSSGRITVPTTSVSSAKVAVMEPGEVGRSAVYSKYSKGPRTLPGVRPMSSVLTFTTKWLLDR
jgi:hypothetical protein